MRLRVFSRICIFSARNSLGYTWVFQMYGDPIFPFQDVTFPVGAGRQVEDGDPAWRGQKTVVKGPNCDDAHELPVLSHVPGIPASCTTSRLGLPGLGSGTGDQSGQLPGFPAVTRLCSVASHGAFAALL